jgi:hypothetical protein
VKHLATLASGTPFASDMVELWREYEAGESKEARCRWCCSSDLMTLSTFPLPVPPVLHPFTLTLTLPFRFPIPDSDSDCPIGL